MLRTLRSTFWADLLCRTANRQYLKQQEVLVLHSYHQGFKWTRDLQSGIESILKNQEVSLYVSYLDSKRFFTDEYMALLTEAFARKFSHREFDLVIVTDNNALALAKVYGQRLFPNTPIIFTGINNFSSNRICRSNRIWWKICYSFFVYPHVNRSSKLVQDSKILDDDVFICWVCIVNIGKFRIDR